MSKQLKDLKVAILSDHCFSFGGAARTTKSIGGLFTNVEYFFLMGNRKSAKEYFNTEKIYFSSLNRLPFLKRYYRYTYFLWPVYIESFDFSKYDLVISSSFSVAHGAITGLNTVHISYIHTPMRYAWDLTHEYFPKRGFFLRRWIVAFFLNQLRVWDVNSSSRADILIANSNFVKKRIFKYWREQVNSVLYPPVKLFTGNVDVKREDYFVAGAPFEKNKGGEFLLECAKQLGFNLKIIGVGGEYKRLKRKYSKYKNILFLGRISEQEKEEVLLHAIGFIATGVEDFGIFPLEAISCGTPVIAYYKGGYKESIKEGINGVFFKEQTISSFSNAYERFLKKEWDRKSLQKSVQSYSEEIFKKEFIKIVLKNIK
ncbi:MAG: glycosyltransferase [Candidatus Dojkabacteria bacterium]|jgi:glycosyltransferase involved in cell wall biosynthesis